MDSLSRFLSKVELPDDPDGCWEWKAFRQNGYGRLQFNRKVWLAHRFCYHHLVAPIPDGMDVCHTCDNPGCVNPNHLFLGTHLENMADMRRKGRSHKPKGELHSNSKLTDEQVRIIRNALGTQREIAAEFSVSQALISLIRRREAWAHVL